MSVHAPRHRPWWQILGVITRIAHYDAPIIAYQPPNGGPLEFLDPDPDPPRTPEPEPEWAKVEWRIGLA